MDTEKYFFLLITLVVMSSKNTTWPWAWWGPEHLEHLWPTSRSPSAPGDCPTTRTLLVLADLSGFPKYEIRIFNDLS